MDLLAILFYILIVAGVVGLVLSIFSSRRLPAAAPAASAIAIVLGVVGLIYL